jgi:hypothetical protein
MAYQYRKSIGDLAEEIALGLISGAVNAFSHPEPHPQMPIHALTPIIEPALEAGIADGTEYAKKIAEVPTLSEIRKRS